MMSVNFHLHKVTHRNERFRIPVEFESIGRGYEHSCATILGAIARTVMAFVGNESAVSNDKLDGRKFQDFVLTTKDRDTEQRTLSECIFSERGIGFHGGTQQGRQRIDNRCGPISNIALVTENSHNDRKNVNRSSGDHRIQGKMPFAGASDFAGVGKRLAVSIDSSTIAGDHNFPLGSHNGNGRSMMEGILGECVTRKHEKSNQPRSVRHRYPLSAWNTHVGQIT